MKLTTKGTKVRFSALVEPTLRHRIFLKITESTQLNNEGNVSWSDDEMDQYISILRDAFVFPPELSRREAGGAVWRGVFDARKKGPLTDSGVLEELQRITNTKLTEPSCRFSMWSRLSYRPPIPRRSYLFQYDGVSIRLANQLPKYMELTDDDMSNLAPIATKDRSGFGFLIASTQARNQTNAADLIFDATEIFQSIYNLTLRTWNIIGSEQKPEAKLLMGPYHFLFKRHTSLVHEAIWYNPNFRDEHWRSTTTESKNLLKVASTVRKALKKLQDHPLREPLTSAALMMNDGMEATDMSRRTLRYWTALERIFQADGDRAPYEKIIRRATYLDDPADLARAKLARLVRIRNRYVHMGTSENEHHQLVQYLAASVSSHLFYLLFNGDDFTSHADFIEMTDLPSDRDALARRRHAIDRRERMIEKRRHRSD